jgi:hypothetical protein
MLLFSNQLTSLCNLGAILVTPKEIFRYCRRFPGKNYPPCFSVLNYVWTGTVLRGDYG